MTILAQKGADFIEKLIENNIRVASKMYQGRSYYELIVELLWNIC